MLVGAACSTHRSLGLAPVFTADLFDGRRLQYRSRFPSAEREVLGGQNARSNRFMVRR